MLPFSDSLDNANGTALATHNGSWTVTGNIVIDSNAAHGDAGVDLALWNADTPSNNQYAQAVLAGDQSNGGQECYVLVRATNNTGYMLATNLGGYLEIVRVDNFAGSQYTVLSSAGGCAPGDVIRLEANGTTLTAYKNGSTTGAPAAVTDATFASGSLGFGFAGQNAQNATIASVTGGNLADTTAPTIGTRTINTAGTQITVNFSENVVAGGGGFNGFALSMSGGAVTATYASGGGSSSLVYNLSRAILVGETGTLAYTQPGAGIQDAATNLLATVSGLAITNNSTNTGNADPQLDSAEPDDTANVGDVYSNDLGANFSDFDLDDLTFSINGEPVELSFDTDTGVLSGTLTRAGLYTIDVTAADGIGTPASDQFLLDVDPAPGESYVDVVSPDTSSANSVFLSYTGDAPASGGQLHYDTQTSGAQNVLMDADGTFTLSEEPTSQVTFDVRYVDMLGVVGGSATWTITIDPNQSPTDIELSSTSVAVNAGTNAAVGTLGATDADDVSHTFTLVAGAGSTNNASFNISGNQLRCNNPAGLGVGSYSVRIQADDGESTPYQEAFSITVTAAANQSPTDIQLSSSSVAEDGGTNAVVGTLTATDADSGSHTFTLVAGTGSTNNASFTISGNQLRCNNPAGLGAGSYSVRIQADDGASTPYQEAFSITVTAAGADVTPPVITRLGSSVVYVNLGDSYVDAGATALDNVDGDITGNIVTVNPVNTAVPGYYQITYNVQDAANNAAAQIVRDVYVSSPVSNAGIVRGREDRYEWRTNKYVRIG